MKKIVIQFYGITSYLIGFSTLVYIIGFLQNILVPKGIDHGIEMSVTRSVIWDVFIVIMYFAIHSLMARPQFKKWSSNVIPKATERSTYVLVSGVTFYLLVLLWVPITQTIWVIENGIIQYIIYGLYLMAWLLMLLATFNIDHWSFFGLRQSLLDVEKQHKQSSPFVIKYLYGFSRHPISCCWMLVMWLTPSMTYGHLILAVIGTLYILIVTPIEEQDLINEIGPEYINYQNKVSRYISFRPK